MKYLSYDTVISQAYLEIKCASFFTIHYFVAFHITHAPFFIDRLRLVQYDQVLWLNGHVNIMTLSKDQPSDNELIIEDV